MQYNKTALITGATYAMFYSGASPDASAINICHLALSPEVLKTDAFYWKNCRPMDPDPYAYNEKAALKAIERSVKLSIIKIH